jgi:hypothetical protein
MITGESAQFESVNRAIPRPGWHNQAPRLLPSGGRLIQTHEIYRNEYQRAIYLVRDVRDVVTSEYFHQTGQGLYFHEFDRFLQDFLDGSVNGYGPWAKNVISWLDAIEENPDHFLLVKFENFRQDPENGLKIIARFLGAGVSDAAIQNAIRQNTLQEMQKKENSAKDTVFKNWDITQRFVRSGTSGGWRQKLSEDQVHLVEIHNATVLHRLGYSIHSQP